MALFVILGLSVLMAVVVLGVLFFMLGKEGDKPIQNDKPAILEPQTQKLADKKPEDLPLAEPKTALPTQPVRTPLEEEVYKKRATELENELKEISQKAATQSDEAKQLIETLTKENQSLKAKESEIDQAKQRLNEVQVEATVLKNNNVQLQTQLDSADAKVKLMEDQMAAIKIQMGEEITKANAIVDEIKREKEELINAPKPEPNQVLLQELDSLKSELAQLTQKHTDLERTTQKLHELNGSLIEKNESLQYELIKARAQTSGLERVSYNYKNQVEDFFKKINDAKDANEQLSGVKNRLEGMVEEIKLQNEELVKKDQLSQFELEKNRSRLNNLEREYEQLKAKLST